MMRSTSIAARVRVVSLVRYGSSCTEPRAVSTAFTLAHGHDATCRVQDIGHLGTQLRHGRVLRPTLLEFADELTNACTRDIDTARNVRLAWPAIIQGRIESQ